MQYPVKVEHDNGRPVLYVLVDTNDSIVQRGGKDFGKWPNVDGSEITFPDGKEFLTVVKNKPEPPEGQTIDDHGYVIDRVLGEYRYEYTYRDHNAAEIADIQAAADHELSLSRVDEFAALGLAFIAKPNVEIVDDLDYIVTSMKQMIQSGFVIGKEVDIKHDG